MSIRKRFWYDDGRTKIKICGITTLDIAYEAAYLGADALGFHLWQGRDVEGLAAGFRYIVRFLPGDVSCWLLTDITNHELLKRFILETGVDTVQFQGKTSQADFVRIIHKLESLRAREQIRFVKSLSMSSRNYSKIMSALNSYVSYVDAVLLDSKWKGGTGTTHDWTLGREIVRAAPKPAILAGGLTPQNIVQAITMVKPYGVDVESGVENVIGSYRNKKIKCKSIIKIREFIVNAKDVARHL